jgi:hypothetical protein
MKLIVLAATAASLFATVSAADTPKLTSGSNLEMKQIFDEDQADRNTRSMKPGTQDRDAVRHEQTRKLLSDGQLHTGQDFTEAAYVFQHGSGEDFLLAHTLAIIATKKGDPDGPHIAAMTLDRYLQSHGAKQIYGTQYSLNSMTSEWTNEPYDRDLISDALRRELGVLDQAAQAAELEKFRNSRVKPTVAAAPMQTTTSCAKPSLERVFVRDKWSIAACGDMAIMATEEASSGRGILFVRTEGTAIKVSRVGTGGDGAEITVATAAFGAMTPTQIADLVAQTKAAQ